MGRLTEIPPSEGDANLSGGDANLTGLEDTVGFPLVTLPQDTSIINNNPRLRTLTAFALLEYKNTKVSF